jgi:hypothetical protein
MAFSSTVGDFDGASDDPLDGNSRLFAPVASTTRVMTHCQ